MAPPVTLKSWQLSEQQRLHFAYLTPPIPLKLLSFSNIGNFVARKVPIWLNILNLGLWGQVSVEQEEGSPFGTEPQAACSGFDPPSIALGLASSSREKADAFLEDQRGLISDQRRLTALQIEKLTTQEHFEQSHLRWRRFNDWMKGGLQIVGLIGGVALLAGIGIAMWSASQMQGLVVDSFSVPRSFTEAGISGDVVADDVTSKLTVIREFAQSRSIARSQDVRQERGEEIKVEIPETGISLAQAWRYMKAWLGKERHLRGNLRSLEGGHIALTVTLDDKPITVEGAANTLDALELQAAEQVFAETDPVNIVWYLGGKGRNDEAMAAAERNAARPYRRGTSGFDLWGAATRTVLGDPELALKRSRISLMLDPTAPTPHRQTMQDSRDLGHDEEMLRHALVLKDIMQRNPARVSGNGEAILESAVFVSMSAVGDFSGLLAAPCYSFCSLAGLNQRNAELAARLHNLKLSRDYAADAEVMAGESGLARARYFSAMEKGEWREAATAARRYGEELALGVSFRSIGNAIQGSMPARLATIHNVTMMRPLLAVALARGGDLRGAHAAADAMPGDCYACLIARGTIAGLERNWAESERWFQRAITAAPSIPFAHEAWGRMLLSKADAEGAVQQFELAAQKGPHFADPLEGWGEALMARKQSHLALAKFAEAEKYAPNWGRLHMKWGEALVYAGKKDDAKKKFARAATLDLTPSEKSELARMH